MSTTHHQVAGKCNSCEACEFTGENTVKPCVFPGNVAFGVAEVGSLFPRLCPCIWESQRTGLWREFDLCFKTLKYWRPRRAFGRSGRQNAHWTVPRVDFTKNRQKPPCSEQRGKVRSVDAARMLVDLVRRSCFAGLQPAVTKHSGTAARSKALSDAATLLASGLQLEVAKRFVTAAQRVVLDQGAILCLCGIAAGGC